MSGNVGEEGLDLEEKLLKLKEYVQGTQAYKDFPSMYRDDWLRLTLVQKKNGKLRTLDYALKKLKDAVENLEALNLKEFEKEIPVEVKKEPMLVKVGLDNEGRDILVTDWARADLKNAGNLWRNYLKYIALATINALKDNPKPQHLMVDFLRTSKEKSVIGYARAVPSVRKMAKVMEAVFYDRIYRRFLFPPKPLIKVVQLVRMVLPENSKAKMVLGSYKTVRKELEAHCKSEEFMPKECGGAVDLKLVQTVLA